MAARRWFNWRTLLSFVTVILSCGFIEANRIVDGEKTKANGLEKWTVIQHHHQEASRSTRVAQKLGRARENWWRTILKSYRHQVKKSSHKNLERYPKSRIEFPENGSQTNVWWHGRRNHLLRPRVHYSTALYKKVLRKDDVEVDDQPLIVLPPDDSPKTPKLKSKPGGTRSINNIGLPPTPALPETPPTPVVPTAPEMPVTEEFTVPPIISSATKKPTAKPPVKPTNAPSQPSIINIIQPPNQTPKPPGNDNNATNIQLNLEIGNSEPNEGIPATQNPLQVLTMTEAPAPPPPQIIIAQPPPTPPPPQPVIIHAAPTPPPAPQPIIIHDAPTPQRVIIHDAHPAEAVFIHAASDPHPDPLVIASPSLPSPPSVILASDVAPSQHSVVVAAPPSVVVASPPASPQGTITLMGLPSLQGPTSAVLMGQTPLQTQMSPMGYPLGMQSPFPFLPSPLMRSPLSPLAPPFPSAMGLGASMYDPQLLMSLTNLFSNALQTTLTQSQPNVLTSALVQAAIQAQTRNQPPDVLTAALTQALAQRMSPNNGQSDTNRLIQALTTALTQVQTQTPLPQPQPQPQTQLQPQLQPQPQPPVPALLPAVAPLPAPVPAPATAYQVLPADPVTTQKVRDPESVDGQSFGNVGKALASALVHAARNLARQKSIYDRDGGRDGDVHRSRPFYLRSYASMMRRPFYSHSFGRRYEERDHRSPITRRSKIASLPLQWTPLLPTGCTCCRCC